MKSLRRRLWGLWLLTAVVGLALAALLLTLYRQTSAVQLRAAGNVVEQACTDVAAAMGEGDLTAAMLDGLLRRYAGVEGGVWDPHSGFIAYAFPTHVGAGIKEDMPATERPLIQSLARAASGLGRPQSEIRAGAREAFIIHACPSGARAAWTMMRVSLVAGELLSGVILGIALLLVFVLAVGVWLALTLQDWSRKLDGIERALAEYPLDGGAPLPLTGSQELDRLVEAINALHRRLDEARRQSEQLARSLAQSERLATIGRTAAALAHEIRNPLATLRLRAENALMDPETRALPALEAVLSQVRRLEGLMQSLLMLSQPMKIAPQDVELRSWLRGPLDGAQPQAEQANITLTATVEGADCARFDPLWLGRALDNLLRNALRHAPPGGSVHVAVQNHDPVLRLRVSDDGPGVPPALRGALFEPFASGQAEGTGLGLALVREVARAHFGEARLIETAAGAEFEITVPQEPVA